MRSYRVLTSFIAPAMPLWLRWRQSKGKEDKARLSERFGAASERRPAGSLLWLHAASVGEANSVLLLIHKIRERFSHLHILLTTGTVTSAQLMHKRLPEGVIHQYVPIDTPQAVQRFMRHWHPEMAFWVESEFWPNLIEEADEYECFMGIINARMSERSFRSWKKRPAMIRRMLECFNIVFAQSDKDAQRLTLLGARDVLCVGNLKHDAALLPCDEGELIRLQKTIGARPLWLAASTHPGEEAMIAQAHALLSVTRPDLLTIIVPRHPQRGGEIAAALQKTGKAVQRAQKQPIGADTSFYVADTLGELGLFYRLCDIVFMGGSLVEHGGQNPLEPARLGCAIVTGTHTQNFADIYVEMENAGGCLRADSPQSLAARIDTLLNNPPVREAMQAKVKAWMQGKSGAAERMLALLASIFAPVEDKI